jgi:acyl-coenzyme A thioesterase 13
VPRPRNGDYLLETQQGTLMTDPTGLELLQGAIGKAMGEVSLSATGRWLNGTLRAADATSLQMEYTIREEMTNMVSTLHGGITAAMLDDSMGMLLNVTSLGEGFFATVNLTVDYLGPARLGDVIIATAQINRKGRQIANLEGWLRHTNGKAIAHATSNLLKIGA